MRKRLYREDWVLLGFAMLTLGLFLLAEVTKTREPSPYFSTMQRAAQRMAESMGAVKAERLHRGIPIDDLLDPERTGMIGVEWSGITSTLGSLQAKRTSTNTDMAALMVKYFGTIGLKAGDAIAVNCSGSFPALNLAVIAAAEEMALEPVIISSVGASTYGGNIPGFSYIDMESHLYRSGYIRHRSAAVFPGGGGDRGEGLDAETLSEIQERARREGIATVVPSSIADSLKTRIDIFQKGGAPIKAFVNIGGNLTASGGEDPSVWVKPGLNRHLLRSGGSENGLIQYFGQRQIPVVELLDMKTLSAVNGIPFDAQSPAKAPGAVYYVTTYGVWIPGVWSVLLLTSLTYFRSRRRMRYDWINADKISI